MTNGPTSSPTHAGLSSDAEDRRRFLETAGKYALGVAPAITLLIASRGALAKSSAGYNGGGSGGNKVGNSKQRALRKISSRVAKRIRKRK